MSGGIEEFIIQLGFDDSEAMKGYKDFLKKLNSLNSKVVSSINKVKKANAEASVASTKAGLEGIKVLQQQNQLRNKIAQAAKMGLDVSSEKRSLASARKYNTIKQRTLELEERISKERLKNATTPPVKPSQTTSPSPSSPSQVPLLNAREGLRGVTTQARKMGIPEKELAMDIDSMTDIESIKMATVQTKKLVNEVKELESVYARMDARRETELQAAKDLAKERKDNTQKIIKDSNKVRKAKKKNLKEIEEAQKQVFKDAEKRAERYQKQVNSIINQSRFRQLAKLDPDRASSLRGELQGFVGRAGNASMSPREIRDLDAEFKNLRASVSDATTQLNRNGRAMLGLQTIQYGLRDSTRHLIRSYASLYAVFMGTSAINSVGQDFQAMRAGMLAVSEDSAAVQENLSFISGEAKRLGLDLVQTSKAFVKLQAAAEGRAPDDKIKDAFTGIVEAGTVFQLSMDDTVGSIRAIQQMFSKEGIMAEEFKSQLGDRIPIAMRALEKSTGKTAKELIKMMEMGQLGADMIVPFAEALGDIAKQGGALEEAMKSGRAQQARFVTGAQEAADVIYQSGFEEGISSMFHTLTEELSEGRKGLEGFGQVFKFVFETIGMTAKIVSPIIDSFMFVFGGLFSAINKINDVIGNNFITTLLTLGGVMFVLRKGLSRLLLIGMLFDKTGDKAAKASKGVKVLGLTFKTVFRGMFFWVTAIVTALDEVFSMFSKDRVGLLEKYIFGEDFGFESWDEFIKYVQNTDSAELLAEFGTFLGSAGYNLRESMFQAVAGFGDFISETLSNIDWGTLFTKLLVTVVQGLSDALLTGLSFYAGVIEGILNSLPFIDKVEVTDYVTSARKKMNDYFDGVSSRQGNILNSSPAATTNNTSISSPINNNRSSTSNNVTNSVTVNYNAANENNFGNQGAIADDIAAKVQEALDQNFRGAELSNGG